jgi:hypothetical protein
MKIRTIIISFAALLLLASGTLVFLKSNPRAGSGPAESRPEGAGFSTAPGNRPGGALPADGMRRRSHLRPEPKNLELVTKYGVSRVNLSRHIAGNLIGLMDELLGMGETSLLNKLMQPNPDAGDAANLIDWKLGVAAKGLNLTDDQISKTAKLLSEHDKRQTAKLKECIGRLKQDPAAIMELMLASDSTARGEMGEAEYKRIESEVVTQLGGQFASVGTVSMDLGEPLEDEAFVRDFKAVLNPDQLAGLDSTMASEFDDETLVPEADVTEALPAMTLEKLDTTIKSLRKVTTGVNGLMELIYSDQDSGIK